MKEELDECEASVSLKKTGKKGKTTGSRRISDEAVRARTGKGWNEWFKILDKWGASEKGHRLSAKHLLEKYKIGPWWAQVVTIRYEFERGLRK